MSYADLKYIETCKKILSEGVWDTDQNVRPHWEDGTPAHTVKCFGVVNRYDLSKEFPLMTLRRTYWKSAIDELLWIWQKKSNNVHDLSSRSKAMGGLRMPLGQRRHRQAKKWGGHQQEGKGKGKASW